jgi:2-iminoacetate synthase
MTISKKPLNQSRAKKSMSFGGIADQLQDFKIREYFQSVTEKDVLSAIHKKELNEKDFLNLLSPRAVNYLEEMAYRAHKLTVQWFGRTIKLYAPLYISNYCTNQCLYCGFNQKNKIQRRKLSPEEIARESRLIAQKGIKHILLLTGESSSHTSMAYLREAVEIQKKYFASICLEMFPMEIEEYRSLIRTGADCLTVYQEVYDQKVYEKVHLAGRKNDYYFRLNTPERGARAGFRALNIGALFSLAQLEKEAYLSGLHAKYLETRYPQCEISISIPRLNPHEGDFNPQYSLSDRKFVQFLLAYRLFLPRVGINISTRESSDFRNHLLKLGVTKMSAGSRTEVGGYSRMDDSTAQFDISDERSVAEVAQIIRKSGYQPVFKDWERP